MNSMGWEMESTVSPRPMSVEDTQDVRGASTGQILGLRLRGLLAARERDRKDREDEESEGDLLHCRWNSM